MQVVIIGAGPSGLACAVCLQRNGIAAEILERSASVGSAWHGHYGRLHLHTSRGRSGLPHMAMPRRYGRYPSRGQMIEYLNDYASAFGLRPRFGTRVDEVRPSQGRWRIGHSAGESHADAVIFATGLNGTPYLAPQPGQDSFPGPVLHSSDYTDAASFGSQRVLVVGLGNSGADIALDLAEARVKVALSVRGPVNILPHELFGIPITSMGGLRKIMPYRWADALTAPVLRARIGRPEDYGLQSAPKGPAAQVIEDGKVPLIDNGTLAALRDGRIAARPGIAMIDGAEVSFADGQAGTFDTIILATGYRTDLRRLLPENPRVLDARGHPQISGSPGPLPGLYFCSYQVSADGQLNRSGLDARAIARHIAAMPGI